MARWADGRPGQKQVGNGIWRKRARREGRKGGGAKKGLRGTGFPATMRPFVASAPLAQIDSVALCVNARGEEANGIGEHFQSVSFPQDLKLVA